MYDLVTEWTSQNSQICPFCEGTDITDSEAIFIGNVNGVRYKTDHKPGIAKCGSILLRCWCQAYDNFVHSAGFCALKLLVDLRDCPSIWLVFDFCVLK